jgi:hypothetical protein
MKLALLGLAVLAPALAAADDPAPYVLHDGRGAAPARTSASGSSSGAAAAKQTSSFGSNAVRAAVTPQNGSGAADAPSGSGNAGSSGGSSSWNAHGFRAARRSSSRRGIAGTPPAGGSGGSGTPAPAPTSAPAWAAPGAKILTAGQQPVYSDPTAPAGTHSVEGGGFIAIDQTRAGDVGRGPGITWAPPDLPPSSSQSGTGSGTGASSNGPAVVTAAQTNTPQTAPSDPSKHRDDGATGFNPAF